MDSESDRLGVNISSLFASCITSIECLNLFLLQVPHLGNRVKIVFPHRVVENMRRDDSCRFGTE